MVGVCDKVSHGLRGLSAALIAVTGFDVIAPRHYHGVWLYSESRLVSRCS
jgi:hypothetical protein